MFKHKINTLIYVFLSSSLAHSTIETTISKHTVYLVSDPHHHSPDSREVFATLARLAVNRKIVCALEGTYRMEDNEAATAKMAYNTNDNGYLFGIEDFETNQLVTALNGYYLNFLLSDTVKNLEAIDNDDLSMMQRDHGRFIDSMNLLSGLPLLLNELKKSKHSNNSVNSFIDMLFDIYRKKLNKDSLSQKEELLVDNLIHTPEWMMFYKALSLFLTEREENRKEGVRVHIDKIIDFIKNPNDNNLSYITDNITVDLRNKFFAKNIISISRITKNTDLPLYAFMGKAHIKGVSDLLRKRGYQVKVIPVADIANQIMEDL